MKIFETILEYLASSGFGQFHWSNGVMILVGFLFIFLAIRKGFEPLLLVPIGFGILIGNIPYDASKLPLSVYDGPVSEHDISYYEVEIESIQLNKPISELGENITFEQYREYVFLPERLRQMRADRAVTLIAGGMDREEAIAEAERLVTSQDVRFDHEAMVELVVRSRRIDFSRIELIEDRIEAIRLVAQGRAVMVNNYSVLTTRQTVAKTDTEGETGLIVEYGQGRALFVADYREDGRYAEVWSEKKQDTKNASVFWWLFVGVGLAGFYPPLIFLGIGALTDFGPMLSNPKTLLLGAAAQFGIFGSLIGALFLGFTMQEAASIGIIGGADGPTAIFTCSQLAPHLLGAVALAAYAYMAMVPIIQPPIIKLLTTPEERRIRMVQNKPVSKRVKIIFPIVGFLLTAFLAPGGLPLLGMLFFGNLLRESLVTDRLAKTAQTTFIDIVTILLGVTVGAKTSAPNFLTSDTIKIFILGMVAFAIATATGVIFGKILNAVTKEHINPMIGAAGVSAVPMAARVVHRLGVEEDPQNFLLMHAMGPNVAGVIGSAVAAGVLLSSV